jgi:hypothetical protein
MWLKFDIRSVNWAKSLDLEKELLASTYLHTFVYQSK